MLSTSVSSTNKTDRHDITEILLKVALNTITLNLFFFFWMITYQEDLYTQNKYISVVTSAPSSQNIRHAANRDKLHTVIEMLKTFLTSLNF
jgi:tRNA U34 5-methylaminomethyl-2-thiouridine-forming methyltransferase MnmC